MEIGKIKTSILVGEIRGGGYPNVHVADFGTNLK